MLAALGCLSLPIPLSSIKRRTGGLRDRELPAAAISRADNRRTLMVDMSPQVVSQRPRRARDRIAQVVRASDISPLDRVAGSDLTRDVHGLTSC